MNGNNEKKGAIPHPKSRTNVEALRNKILGDPKCTWCDGCGETVSGFICYCRFKKPKT